MRAALAVLGFATALAAGCMSPVAPNDPPRGDREDHQLSNSFHSRVPPIETKQNRNLDIQVDIDLLEYTPAGAASVEAAFQPQEADLTVSGGVAVLAKNGLRVGLAGRSFFGAIAGQFGSASVRRRTWQSLLVHDSAAGGFKIGQERTAAMVLTYCDRNQLMKELPVAQASVTLEVTPKLMASGELKIRLVPVLHYHDKDRGQQDISFPDLAMEAIVRDGESIAVGAVPSEGSTLGSTFFRPTGGETEVKTAYLLTPKMRG